MTLHEWVQDTIKNGVELFNDSIISTNDKGISLRRDTKILRQLSLGAISTNTAKEWWLICRLHSPVGTVIDDYDPDKWESMYEEVIALCRLALTKALVDERNAKSAKVLTDILTKRDAQHWQEKKEVAVNSNNEQPISISIVGI